MNREQFIAQLARLLQDLPPAERQEAIRYYQEYFDDAGEENEDAVIQELGSPGKVAASIKANLQYGGSTFGANDTDMENTGTESQTKDADGWQQNGQTMNRWNQSTQQGWQNADTQGQSGQQQTWQNSSTQSPYAMQARKPKRGVGGWALLIIILVFASPMLLGGIRGGNDLVDAFSINSGDFQEMKDEVMSEISDHTNFDPVNWFVEWVTDIF